MDYINEWLEALQIEINFLKKYGGSKYKVRNGRFITNQNGHTYFFETGTELSFPVGASVKLQFSELNYSGKILSVEGNSLIVSLEQPLGDLIEEAIIIYDPWELLEELSARLIDAKKSKRKLQRIKHLVEPLDKTRHPTEKVKSNIHELFYRSQYNPVTFVWGPPGTGKTYSLARVAANKFFQGKSVLILSNSNQAVDVLLHELVHFLDKKSRFKEGEILRYGAGSKQHIPQPITAERLLEKQEPRLIQEKRSLSEEKRLLKQDISVSFSKRDSDSLLALEKKLTSLIEKIRQKEIKLLKEAKIVGATLAKAASDEALYGIDFDLVIIDEVSMAYVPQIAFAASLGKKVIVCGDFKQLPPIAAARHDLVEKWLKEDIFHRAGVVQNLTKDLHPQLMLLNEQRRMHPHISAFTNKVIYGGKVFDHGSMKEKRKELVAKKPFPHRASVLVDTSFTGQYCMSEKSSRSRFNLWQLLTSFQLIHEAFLDGVTSIGYVTPYRAQAMLMDVLLKSIYEEEKAVADIIAATVHRFQGSERDVMIFDTVDSYPEARPGMLLVGKDSERLVNVAITRTKGKFMQVSDRQFIKNKIYKGKTLRELVDHQEEHNQVITHQQIGSWIKHQHPKLHWVHALKLERAFEDVKNSKRSIIVATNTTLPKEWYDLLGTLPEKMQKTLISTDAHHRNFTRIDKEIPFPFVIIDEEIIWLGLPLVIKNLHSPFVAIRLQSKPFIQLFAKQLPI